MNTDQLKLALCFIWVLLVMVFFLFGSVWVEPLWNWSNSCYVLGLTVEMKLHDEAVGVI